jgi:hypothetical protein
MKGVAKSERQRRLRLHRLVEQARWFGGKRLMRFVFGGARESWTKLRGNSLTGAVFGERFAAI